MRASGKHHRITVKSPGDRQFVRELVRYFVNSHHSSDAALRLGHAAQSISSWSSVDDLIVRHRVSALSYRVLNEPDVRRVAEIPSEYIETLRDRYVQSFHQVVLEPRALFELMDALSAENIRALAIKGLVLGSWLYPDPALREHEDLDLLIPETDAQVAGAVMAKLGYHPAAADNKLPRFSERESLNSATFPGSGKRLTIDLSFDPLRLFWKPENGEPEWFDAWWARKITVGVSGRDAYTLGPEDQFIYLARHLQFHDYYRMNWYIDLALLVRSRGLQIDWDLVGAIAGGYHLTGGIYRSLELIDEVFGETIPIAAWNAIRPGLVVRTLHRRVWPDDLAMPRDSPSHGGSPTVPRYIGLHGSHPIAASLLLAIHPERKANATYMFRRFFPSQRWLRAMYSESGGVPMRRINLLRAHWRKLRKVKAGVRH